MTAPIPPMTLRDDQGRVLRLVPGTLRRGGQADVWRALTPDDRAVAVKIYREVDAAAARERAMNDVGASVVGLIAAVFFSTLYVSYVA